MGFYCTQKIKVNRTLRVEFHVNEHDTVLIVTLESVMYMIRLSQPNVTLAKHGHHMYEQISNE